MCHIRATAVQMKHQTHLSEGVVDAESRLGNRVPPRGIPALDIPRPFVRTVSPEGSYHYRFYRLAADNLPISPISYHPSADNTTILGNLPPLSVLFPALPCSLSRARYIYIYVPTPTFPAISLQHFRPRSVTTFRHFPPCSKTLPPWKSSGPPRHMPWVFAPQGLCYMPPRLMIYAPKAYWYIHPRLMPPRHMPASLDIARRFVRTFPATFRHGFFRRLPYRHFPPVPGRDITPRNGRP